MGTSWNVNDLDFDAEGRLVIKNVELIRIITKELDIKGEIVLHTTSIPNPFPIPQPSPAPWPTPDAMCMCVARRRPGPEPMA